MTGDSSRILYLWVHKEVSWLEVSEKKNINVRMYKTTLRLSYKGKTILFGWFWSTKYKGIWKVMSVLKPNPNQKKLFFCYSIIKFDNLLFLGIRLIIILKSLTIGTDTTSIQWKQWLISVGAISGDQS